MTCEINKEKLISFVYGEMDESEIDIMKTHVESCDICQSEMAELNQVRSALETWEDVDPSFQLTFVPMAPPKRRWLETVKSIIWNPRITWAIPAVAILLFVFLNARVVYDNGNMAILFGHSNPDYQNSEAVLVSQMQSMQLETLQMVQQMIQISESQQSQQVAGQLTRFAEFMEARRQRDLMLVGQELQGLHVNSLSQYQQTNAILSDLIQMTNYQDTLQ